MLLLKLDESRPKARQILEQVRRMIETRTLRAGDKLPSTRRLAEGLGIHRSTVALAYQQLWSLGYLDQPRAACPRVRQRKQLAEASRQPRSGCVQWSRTASPAANAILQSHQDLQQLGKEASAGVIDFSTLDMDPRLLPIEEFRSCLNRVIKSRGAILFRYGERAGYRPLREYIARRLHLHGVAADPEEILLTNGSQQAIDLVLRMAAVPGRSVAIESPTYNYVLPLIRFCGLTPVEIPLRKDGMDLEALARTIDQSHPALVYTMPNFQNPTGRSTSQAHRERLLSLCEKHRLPILEDGFEEEMKYSGKTVLPIKSMDTRNLVIYCGTFSKVLFPGIRIGWVAADRDCIERLTAIRRFSDLASGMMLQAALYEFCREGSYDLHISRMHRVFRKRMQTAVRALRDKLPAGRAEWEEPGGGYLIWLKLKLPRSCDWENLFAAHRVKASPGVIFFASRASGTYLRLSISSLSEEEIVEGISRIAAALRSLRPGG